MRPLALTLALALVGCRTPPDRAAPRPPGTIEMVKRLHALAVRPDRDRDPMMSSLRVKAIGAEPVPPDPSRRIARDVGLTIEQLRAGQMDAAIPGFERLLREVSGFTGPGVREVQLAMLDWVGLAHLTASIRQWCLTGPAGDRCIVPVNPASVNDDAKREARAALEAYRRLLDSRPDDWAAHWLVNLAAMVAGDYPTAPSKEWLLDPSRFRSEHDLPAFPEIAADLGLDVKGHAGGAIMDDFTGDGYLDLVISSMGLDDQLRFFVNNRNGTFTERTTEAGLTGLTGGLNAIQTDYDNDGRLDILVIRGGWDRLGGQPLSLLRNLGGGRFEDVTQAAGLYAFRSTQTAAWGDFNNDGWLDLYIGIESTPDRRMPNQLFLNQKNGTFKDVTEATGTGVVGYTKGVTWGDFDNDGKLDLYVSRMDGPNVLLRNLGPDASGQWRFADVTAKAGVAEPVESFSTWFWDYDGDGWLDLYVSGYRFLEPRNPAADVALELAGKPFRAETPRLYHNNRDGTFTDVTRAVRLDRVVYAMGSNYGDLDNDGFPDLYAATGDPDFRSIIPNRMFRNDGGARFDDVTAAGGFGLLTKGHGVAFGDLDNDGDQDLFVNMGGMFEADLGRSALFLNPGNGNHSIGLRLVGVKTNRAAIGARIAVTVTTDRGTERVVHDLVSSGGSFGANSLSRTIGLGPARAVREVKVMWPGSGTETWRDLALDHGYILTEGNPTAAPSPAQPIRLRTKAAGPPAQR